MVVFTSRVACRVRTACGSSLLATERRNLIARERSSFTRPGRSVRAALIGTTALVAASLAAVPARAQSATWNGTTSGVWNTGTNWTSTPANTVPTATATFGASQQHNVTFSPTPLTTSVGTLQISTGLNNYSFNLNSSQTLSLTGVGIVDGSSGTVGFYGGIVSGVITQNGSGGSPGTVIASTRIPGSWIAQLAAPSGLAAGGPLATAQSNTMMFGAGVTTAWAQPAVSLNGSGNFATPVTSGNYTILLAGYDATAVAAVATVSTIAYLGGGMVSGPVPQPSVPQAAYQAMGAATADTVVFAGGTTPSSHFASVWTASWDPTTGTVGAWTAQTSLPAAVVAGGMATSGSFVYVAGGNTANTNATSTAAVWYASAVNGQIQSWTAGPALPQAVSSPYVAVVNGWLIAAGGTNASGTVQSAVWYSLIKPDGSLAGWQPGPPLSVAASDYSPGWNLAVTSDAMAIVAGITTGGSSVVTQTLTVTPDGPAAAWQTMEVYNFGGEWQTAAYQGAAGQWDVFNFHLANYDVVPLVPLPLISVPLAATGLTGGGTYHIVCHQDGGDLNDYTSIGLDPGALPIAVQTRPNGGGSWTGMPGYMVIASVWDQTPGGQILHTWEDAGARITAMVYAGSGGQLLGLCEATAFEDGTTLAAVTQVVYGASGLPTGTVQLA